MIANRISFRLFGLTLGLSLAGVAGPATAQTAPNDWERVDRGGDISATLSAADAPLLSVTCSSGHLVVLIGELPAAAQADRSRGVFIEQGGQTLSMPWIAGAADEVLAGAPRPVARALRRGGRVTLRLTSGVTPTQYDLDLPTQSAAVAEVMERCDTPLEDARDDLPPLDYANLEWLREPVPARPDRIRQTGLAVVSCVTAANGRLRDCILEAEFPAGVEMGRTATQAYRMARIRGKNGEAAPEGQLLTAALLLACRHCDDMFVRSPNNP